MAIIDPNSKIIDAKIIDDEVTKREQSHLMYLIIPKGDLLTFLFGQH
jgi:hypothetical protein